MAVAHSFVRVGAGGVEMLAAVNAERRKRGLPDLRIDSRLMRAAQKHSEYQHAIGVMTHDGNGGLGARLRAEGFQCRRGAAENVAWGYQSVADVMRGWIRSPGHYSNMMRPGTYFGWGRCGSYWTQVFGD
jgi:uncharacterized protein YkwD